MAYYGGGAHALRQALMLGGRPGIVPPIQMPQQRPQQAPAQQAPARMRQPAVSYPSRPAAPPQVAPGSMTPQQVQALGRGGSAKSLYPNEGIRREPNQPNRHMTGTQKFMSQMLGAQPKTGADLDRLDAAKRMGLVGAGISLLGNIGGVQRPDLPGHPGSFGRNLADALSTGIGMSRGTFAGSEPAAPEFITGPGGGVYRYDSETDALTQAVPGVGEQYTLAPGARRFGPGGQLLAEGAPETTTDEANFEYFMGLPEGPEKQFFREMLKGTPGVTVNTGSEYGAVKEAYDGMIAGGFTQASNFINQSLPRINRAITISEDPELRAMTGPLSDIKLIVERLTTGGYDENKGLALAQEFNVLTGAEGLRILTAFTGPKTEKEQEIAWRLASADLSLSADEITAGLQVMRRAEIFANKAWADEVLLAGPAIAGDDPQAWRSISSMAQRAKQEYDEELKRMEELGLDNPYARLPITENPYLNQ
jgi:hypothetical protein